jgi:hypothetical protein
MLVKAEASVGLVMLTSVVACDPWGVNPGPCEYREIPGVGTIVSVSKLSPEESRCLNAVRIIYDFSPDDPAARDTYLFPNYADTGHRYTVQGWDPPASWAEARGLTAGSVHRCVRSEMTKGACGPGHGQWLARVSSR